jgi:hypothetical protein
MAQLIMAESAEPSTPSTGKAVITIDTNGNLCKKDDAGNLMTLACAGDFTLTIPAGGTAALLEAANIFTALQTMPHSRSRQDTIADDAVLSITPTAVTGIIEISSTTDATVYGIVTYRAASTPFAQIIAGGSNFETSTSVLAGTTGNDTKVTFSANSGGTLYLENRRGGSIVFRISFRG